MPDLCGSSSPHSLNANLAVWRFWRKAEWFLLFVSVACSAACSLCSPWHWLASSEGALYDVDVHFFLFGIRPSWHRIYYNDPGNRDLWAIRSHHDTSADIFQLPRPPRPPENNATSHTTPGPVSAGTCVLTTLLFFQAQSLAIQRLVGCGRASAGRRERGGWRVPCRRRRAGCCRWARTYSAMATGAGRRQGERCWRTRSFGEAVLASMQFSVRTTCKHREAYAGTIAGT